MLQRIFRLWIVLSLFGLAGCTFPVDFFFSPPVNAPESPGLPLPGITGTPDAPTETPLPPTETPVPCAYVWEYRPLVDETSALQSALNRAGLGLVEGAATAYGENCVDINTKTVVRFSVMQTDFFFNVPVSNAADRVALGRWIEQILRVTRDFPPGKVPGPNMGYLTIVFKDSLKEARVYTRLETAYQALEKGSAGDSLYSALGGQ